MTSSTPGQIESDLQTILESIQDGFVMVRRDLTIGYANSSAGKLLHVDPREVVGRAAVEVLPPGEKGSLESCLQAVLERSERRDFEDHFPSLNAWLRFRLYPAAEGVNLFITDSTQRRLAEEALRRSEAEFRAIFESSASGKAQADPETGKLLRVNPKYAEIFGYEPQELIGRPFTDLTHPSQRARDWEQFQRMVRGETGDYVVEKRGVRKDGALLWIDSRARVVRDETGRAMFTTAVINDITWRKQAELELRESRSRLQAVLDVLPVGVFITDKRGHIVTSNPAADRIWGGNVPRISVEQSGRYKAWWPDGRPVEPHEWGLHRAVYKGEVSGPEEVRIEAFDGVQRTILNYALPVRDSSGRVLGAVAVNVDIEDRKQAEEQRRLLTAALERSNEDLRQFAYVVSHDLQEPLRAVTMFLELLLDRYGEQLDKRAHEYIDFAMQGSQQMSQLILALLDFSRVQTRPMEVADTDMNEVFVRARANTAASIRETDAAVTAEALPTVRGDRTQLIQLLQNLISNSLKFRRDGVRPEVHVAAERQGGRWLFRLRDNGIGIPEQFHKEIFQVFRRLHERGKYPGTGMGLAICKRIIERHGGTIWVESKEGEGSTFHFTLPA